MRGVELDIAEHGMSERQVKAHERAQEARQAAEKAAEPPGHVEEPSETLRAAWAAVDEQLREAVDESTYRIWLAHLHPHARLAGTWYVGADPRAATWIGHRFCRLITAAAGRPVVFVRCDRAAVGGAIPSAEAPDAPAPPGTA